MTTIQLAKKYEPKKLIFPVLVSEKIDGVPVIININFTKENTTWYTQTRQGHAVPSVADQVKELVLACLRGGVMDCTLTFVAEVNHTNRLMPFKDVSGHVRTQEQNDDLVLNFFDFVYNGQHNQEFYKRIAHCAALINSIDKSTAWRMIPQVLCENEAFMKGALEGILEWERGDGSSPEGAIIRNHNEGWRPGKRTWGYQKYIQDPAVDLQVESFEEAISQTGEPLGMVGRINCYYKDGIIGVGPGKLTHDERRDLWEKQKQAFWWGPIRICTVKYKRDDSYEALRQPTFQHWREDKTEPNEDD